MAQAAEQMRDVLAGITFSDPTVTLLANADARPITTGEGARAELIEHLTAGVDWVAAVEHMAAAGVTTFVEVGPGQGPDRPDQADRPRRRDPRRPTTRPPSTDS